MSQAVNDTQATTHASMLRTKRCMRSGIGLTFRKATLKMNVTSGQLLDCQIVGI